MPGNGNRGPEMVFGLVSAIGTDLQSLREVLAEALAEVGYTTDLVHIIELLREVDGSNTQIKDSPIYDRYQSRMEAGNAFREKLGRPDALALLAVHYIRQQARLRETGDSEIPASRRAYILRSVKHPQEVETLRRIYGPGFFLVGTYSPQNKRRENLVREIAASRLSVRSEEDEANADDLIRRDDKEPHPYGQNVRDAFPLADVFVDVSKPREEVKTFLSRFVAVLFSYQFHTPSRDEYGMFMAHATALRSAEMGRQVGAAITDCAGEVISLGTNEVPKAGGGLYWPDDRPDRRDFQLGYDSSDHIKRASVSELIGRLREQGWLREEVQDRKTEAVVHDALRLLSGTRTMSPVEYSRAVHAEMAALMNAARRGISLRGGTLYVTTFPCHNCARHIVTAGIKRVVYIEPYPKSLGPELHDDAIVVEGDAQLPMVSFEPFVGIAPRQYSTLFAMSVRKYEDGKVVSWDKLTALPRQRPPSTSYLVNEEFAGEELDGSMEQAGLKASDDQGGSEE